MSRVPSSPITTGAPGSTEGWRVLAVAAVLALSALGAYWNSCDVPFLLDDKVSIDGNPSIQHLGRIVDILSPSSPAQTVARPLLNLSLALNYAAGGMSVRGYHVVNLFIHICAGLALLGIVRRTLLLPPLRHRYGEAALPLAAFAALLWTLHPLQTEAVTYISQRAESLMGLFYLLTLYGFICSVPSQSSDMGGTPMPRGTGVPPVGLPKIERHGWLGLSVIACLCGMATKQVMVTAPVLVLLYDRAFVSGSFRSALANRRWYYASLAATWLLLGLLMHHSSLTAISVGFQSGVSWLTYGLTELRVVTDYLRLAFWPHPLVFDYGSEILVTDPQTVGPYALVIVAILVGVAFAWRRWPMVGFLGCWFFLILAPTSTVVPIADQPMAESRMYLPLAAVVVLVTLLGYALVQRRIFVVLGFVAVGLGVLTVLRNHDYRSALSIWEDTVARNPHTSRGHCNLGIALAQMPGRLPDAMAQFETALLLNPAYAEAHGNLGLALAQLPGRLPDAIAHYEAALRSNPNYAEAHNNLAVALAQVPGRLPEAMAHYEASLQVKPTDAGAHNNLGLALGQMPGRLPEALAQFEEALRLKPDLAETHYNFAVVLAKTPGRLPEAIAQFEEALRLKPDFAGAHGNLANALAKMPGRLADAIAHYETAVRLAPGSFEAHYNLSVALVKVPGRLPDAIVHSEAAVRLKPDSAEAHNNLANVLAQMPGRRSDAIAHYEEAVRLNPNYVDARNNLAVHYAQTGRLEDAIGQLEIAARLNPAATAIRDNLEKMKARNRPDVGRSIP
jgi:protein O-mannosyl-transferase